MISYSLFLLVLLIQFGLMAQATDLLGGHAGRMGLSAPIFAGVGAYSYALMTTVLTWEPSMSVVGALGFVLLVSVPVGVLMLKLNGDGFLLGTFAAQVALVDLVKNLPFAGGPLGIRNIPAPAIPFFGSETTLASLAVLVPIILVTTISLVVALRPGSSLGRVYHWIRDDFESALVYGVRIEPLMLGAFSIHAAISGIVGISIAIAHSYIGPASFELWLSLSVLTVVFLSGTGGNPTLMILGSLVFVGVLEIVNAIPLKPEMVGAFQQILINLVLIALLTIRRRGIGGPKLEAGPSAVVSE